MIRGGVVGAYDNPIDEKLNEVNPDIIRSVGRKRHVGPHGGILNRLDDGHAWWNHINQIRIDLDIIHGYIIGTRARIVA